MCLKFFFTDRRCVCREAQVTVMNHSHEGCEGMSLSKGSKASSRFFFPRHECGRHVGRVPRSPWKERRHWMKGKEKQNQTQTTRCFHCAEVKRVRQCVIEMPMGLFAKCQERSAHDRCAARPIKGASHHQHQQKRQSKGHYNSGKTSRRFLPNSFDCQQTFFLPGIRSPQHSWCQEGSSVFEKSGQS